MSKMTTWTAVMGGVTLLFYFGGVLNNTPTTSLLNTVLQPQNLEQSDLYLAILGLGAVIAAVVSTFLSRNASSDFWVMAPIVTVLFTFGWDFLSVYRALAASSTIGSVIAVLIFGPVMLMYIIGVMEWWRGVSP